MARKTIFISDLSGEAIEDGDAARVVITYSDARRGVIVLDARASELEEMAAKGTKQARRGRRPGKTEASSSPQP